MSSPEKEKHLSALTSLEMFCEAHNEKINLVEQIQALLFKCNIRFFTECFVRLERLHKG